MRAAAKRLSYAQKSCLSKAGKLMYRTSMLRPGSRLGVAVSGGMDSWTLLKVLLLHRQKLPFRVEIMALHVNPGFDPENHKPLLHWLDKNGLAGHVQVADMGPRAHSPENKKRSPCFFCSWRRRKSLFRLVKKYSLTHLALGHNADDLVQNFFMNLFYNGRVEGMYPRESFFQGEFELIRPLLLLEKRVISRAVRDWGLSVWSNPCPSAQRGKRKGTQDWLQEIWTRDKRLRKNVFSALKRWQMQSPRP
ncbi:MAG: tRNA 2-thiocytidine biosynthesis TtcA family protein [Desulfohalobiaceae bacterium]